MYIFMCAYNIISILWACVCEGKYIHIYKYICIYLPSHTCPQNTNNIICTHKNIHKIYNILMCVCVWYVCV